MTKLSDDMAALLLEDTTEFTPAARVLAGLSATQAAHKGEAWPHSILEILAHMVFWQRQVLNGIAGKSLQSVERAALGWPQPKPKDWPRLKKEFLAGLEEERAIANNAALFVRTLPSNRSVAARLHSHARHDAYHLGQIVLLRRLMGAWPPPGGGDTW